MIVIIIRDSEVIDSGHDGGISISFEFAHLGDFGYTLIHLFDTPIINRHEIHFESSKYNS